jgi:hypothetical protein
LKVTTKSFSEGPDANTSDAFEQVGRLFETDGAERTLLQMGPSLLGMTQRLGPLATVSPLICAQRQLINFRQLMWTHTE